MYMKPEVVKKKKFSNISELIREKKVKEAEEALINGDFDRAAKILKEIANICFDREEFDLGMELVESAEKLMLYEFDENFDKASRILISLQDQASKAFSQQRYDDSVIILKKMLAIAKRKKDPILVKNYQENIRKVKMKLKETK
ncbi:MAG: hypothetical protein ACFFCS_03120 [Candidatus Hodarchaeota archaeon]